MQDVFTAQCRATSTEWPKISENPVIYNSSFNALKLRIQEFFEGFLSIARLDISSQFRSNLQKNCSNIRENLNNFTVNVSLDKKSPLNFKSRPDPYHESRSGLRFRTRFALAQDFRVFPGSKFATTPLSVETRNKTDLQKHNESEKD